MANKELNDREILELRLFLTGKIGYYVQKGDDLVEAGLKSITDYQHMFNYLRKSKNGKNFNYKLGQIGVSFVNAKLGSSRSTSYQKGFKHAERIDNFKIANQLNATIIDQFFSERFMKILQKLKLKKVLEKNNTNASDEISQRELTQIMNVDELIPDLNFTTSAGYQQSLMIPTFLVDFLGLPLDLLSINHPIWKGKSPNFVGRLVVMVIVSSFWFSILHFLFKKLTSFQIKNVKKKEQKSDFKTNQTTVEKFNLLRGGQIEMANSSNSNELNNLEFFQSFGPILLFIKIEKIKSVLPIEFFYPIQGINKPLKTKKFFHFKTFRFYYQRFTDCTKIKNKIELWIYILLGSLGLQLGIPTVSNSTRMTGRFRQSAMIERDYNSCKLESSQLSWEKESRTIYLKTSSGVLEMSHSSTSSNTFTWDRIKTKNTVRGNENVAPKKQLLAERYKIRREKERNRIKNFRSFCEPKKLNDWNSDQEETIILPSKIRIAINPNNKFDS